MMSLAFYMADRGFVPHLLARQALCPDAVLCKLGWWDVCQMNAHNIPADTEMLGYQVILSPTKLPHSERTPEACSRSNNCPGKSLYQHSRSGVAYCCGYAPSSLTAGWLGRAC